MTDNNEILVPQSIWDELPAVVKAALAKLPEDKQELFVEEYKRKRKSVGIAYLSFIFGLHYAYLGKWGLTLLFWFTLGGFGLWWLIDLFRTYFMVKNKNRDIAIEVMRTIKMITGE